MTLTFTDEQVARLLELLGLPADTTDVATVLATVEDLAAAESAGGGKPSEIAAAAGRLGLTVVDADTLTALHAAADEGRHIQAAAARAEIEGTVTDAIGKGKITPGRRKHWINLITADPAMADVLASVPNETAMPLTEIGYSKSLEGDDLTGTPTWFR